MQLRGRIFPLQLVVDPKLGYRYGKELKRYSDTYEKLD
jgi:hypothetical protein